MSRLSESDISIPTLTLSIVHLDHSIDQIDHRPIADTVTCVLDHFSCSTPSDARETLLTAPSSNKPSKVCPTLRGKVEQSIMRYLRDSDRWTSFTSLMLKSLAFHRSVDHALGISLPAEDEDDTLAGMKKLEINEKKLPIVDLPRTKYNRPYLPLLMGGNKSCTSSYSVSVHAEDVNENYNSMMNVSHQHPWVCMAQQQLRSSNDNENSKSHFVLGLDVVVFDVRISQFTPTITGFLKSFVQSFTPWEWKRITDCQCSSWLIRKTTKPRSDQSKLREFFLRWSMKEAYTKALGLGMHVNFDEFETKLYGIDLDVDKDAQAGEDDGIWTSIMMGQEVVTGNPQRQIGQCQFSVIGKVKRMKPTTSWEFWEFLFVPLQSNSAHETTGTQLPSDESTTYNSCACICRGHLAKKESESYPENNPTAIESLTLVDLIQLHGSNPL